MDDAELVAVDQGVKDGRNDVTSLCLRESLLLQDLIEQLTSLHKFHDQEEVLIILVDVVKLNNIGVVDLLQNVDFILKANFVFLRKFSLCDDFDCYAVSCRPRPALTYACEASLANHRLNLVVRLDVGRVDTARCRATIVRSRLDHLNQLLYLYLGVSAAMCF